MLKVPEAAIEDINILKEIKARPKLSEQNIFLFLFYPFAPEDLMSRNEGSAVPSRVSPTGIRNHDKILARSNQPEHQLFPLHDDDLGYELQRLLSGMLPAFQNLNYSLL